MAEEDNVEDKEQTASSNGAASANLSSAQLVEAVAKEKQSSEKQTINEIYLSDIENVKNRSAGSLGEKIMAEKLSLFLQNNGFSYFNNFRLVFSK